jgi:DNA-binding PadR family transcriptional regulator
MSTILKDDAFESVRSLVESDAEHSSKYVEAKDTPSGKRAACVAGIIDQLVEADGAPLPYALLLENVGMEDQPAQMMPALHALELTGVVTRYSYVEDGKTKARIAYSLNEEVEVK